MDSVDINQSHLRPAGAVSHLTTASRRGFLGLAGAAAACMVLRTGEAEAAQKPKQRSISLQSLHTGEKIKAVYWQKNAYDKQALASIAKVMRDHRNGKVHPIDPRLLDLLSDLAFKIGTKQPFLIISGYRSPETNALLASYSDGVAKHSLHMEGKAIDIRLAGQNLSTIRKVAMGLKRGGVGYYPKSGFVHVDTGKVRYW